MGIYINIECSFVITTTVEAVTSLKGKAMIKKSILLRGLVVTLLFLAVSIVSLDGNAQGVPWFEVAVAEPGAVPVTLQGVQELSIDDIVFDYQAVASPPPGSPVDLSSAQQGDYRLYSPGQAHWGNARITVDPGVGGDSQYQWWQDAVSGKGIRKNISVTLFKSDKTAGRRYNFFDCFPVSYQPPNLNSASSAHATERLTVNIGHIEFADPEQSSSAVPGNVYVTFGDGNGGSVTDTWDSWGGGEPALILSQIYTGSPFRIEIPGHKAVEELTLSSSAWLGKKGYDAWITRALAGSPWLSGPKGTETGYILLRFRKRPELLRTLPDRSYTFYDCFPVRYVFPRLSVTNTTGNVMEEVSIKPIRVELK